MTDFATYLLTISVTDYRRIRKAVMTLVRAGVTLENAANVVIVAHMDRAGASYRPKVVSR